MLYFSVLTVWTRIKYLKKLKMVNFILYYDLSVYYESKKHKIIVLKA